MFITPKSRHPRCCSPDGSELPPRTPRRHRRRCSSPLIDSEAPVTPKSRRPNDFDSCTPIQTKRRNFRRRSSSHNELLDTMAPSKKRHSTAALPKGADNTTITMPLFAPTHVSPMFTTVTPTGRRRSPASLGLARRLAAICGLEGEEDGVERSPMHDTDVSDADSLSSALAPLRLSFSPCSQEPEVLCPSMQTPTMHTPPIRTPPMQTPPTTTGRRDVSAFLRSQRERRQVTCPSMQAPPMQTPPIRKLPMQTPSTMSSRRGVHAFLRSQRERRQVPCPSVQTPSMHTPPMRTPSMQTPSTVTTGCRDVSAFLRSQRERRQACTSRNKSNGQHSFCSARAPRSMFAATPGSKAPTLPVWADSIEMFSNAPSLEFFKQEATAPTNESSGLQSSYGMRTPHPKPMWTSGSQDAPNTKFSWMAGSEAASARTPHDHHLRNFSPTPTRTHALQRAWNAAKVDSMSPDDGKWADTVASIGGLAGLSLAEELMFDPSMDDF